MSLRDEAVALAEQWAIGARRATHGVLYQLQGPTGLSTHVLIGREDRGDYRVDRNTLADVRRALRRIGVAPQGDDDEEEATVTPAERPVRTAPGLHVERRRRVLIEEEAEVTVTLEAIVTALGVPLQPGARITLHSEDSATDGTNCVGPVVLRITSTSMEES